MSTLGTDPDAGGGGVEIFFSNPGDPQDQLRRSMKRIVAGVRAADDVVMIPVSHFQYPSSAIDVGLVHVTWGIQTPNISGLYGSRNLLPISVAQAGRASLKNVARRKVPSGRLQFHHDDLILGFGATEPNNGRNPSPS